MAFPASKGILALVLARASSAAQATRVEAVNARDRIVAGTPTSSTQIIDLELRLAGYRVDLEKARVTPGIGPYAQEQLAEGTLDVAAEFVAMLAAIDTVRTWIRTNFPKDATGYVLARTWGPDGLVDRTFPASQLGGLKTQLDALIATIG